MVAEEKARRRFCFESCEFGDGVRNHNGRYYSTVFSVARRILTSAKPLSASWNKERARFSSCGQSRSAAEAAMSARFSASLSAPASPSVSPSSVRAFCSRTFYCSLGSSLTATCAKVGEAGIKSSDVSRVSKERKLMMSSG